METALLIDFGSTYTKVTLVDLNAEKLLGTAKAFTTIDTDIMEGLAKSCAELKQRIGFDPLSADKKIACSSAAGGLKLIAVGLVRDLTVEAARRAALGAGARVLEAFAHRLTARELKRMRELAPDIILLAGGTDGGNQEVLIENARLLAEEGPRVPVVVAGNKAAADTAADFLRKAGLDCRVTENVMPEVNKLNVEPARGAIREVFLEKIVEAKGLKRAEQLIDQVMMPTPAAVLTAAKLLSQGVHGHEGLGELIVLDIGGATTDVHSIAKGDPTKAGVILKGLPEPLAKRTVEGDLGMRYSARALCEAAGQDRLSRALGAGAFARLEAFLDRIDDDPGFVPRSDPEWELDEGLASVAADMAVGRHTGIIEAAYTPFGASYVQYGKDLTACPNLIGTGGVLVNHRSPAKILGASLFNEAEPTILRPQKPKLWVDSNYILAAMGLLAEIAPETAFRISRQWLKEV